MNSQFALFRLGFRPFFFGATIYAILSVLIWTGLYTFSIDIPLGKLSPVMWHAHEMIYGYAIAIIAGFLLTAAKTWTSQQTPHGIHLFIIFMFWALARISILFVSIVPVWLIATLDSAFVLLTLTGIAIPIIKVKQWRQLLILLILLLLLAGNIAFYSGLMKSDYALMSKGIYAGLYLVIALIVVMGGRVIPFFIERGVGYQVQLVNKNWINVPCIVLFLVYIIIELFFNKTNIIGPLSAILFVLHGLRLGGWHTKGIWKKPLLWILFIAYGFLVLGFALKFMSIYFSISPFIAVHAFGYGGVGVITLGMICRIIWGHTGRNIQQPPEKISWVFVLIISGAIVRVFIPLLTQSYYLLWIGLSQVLWILAFSLFLYLYTPALIQPRPDGSDG